MPSLALTAESVSKRYRIGAAPGYLRFSELLQRGLGRALRLTTRRREPTSAEAAPFWALQDVSFEVDRGEVVAVIGRNGAGKSTLLRIVSKITRPTSGRVGLNGRVGSLLEVGTGFHPELTGRENIYLNGSILGMSRRDVRARFDQIVDFAEVQEFLDTPVKFYSSGMYVRLGFAVAAHLEPEILLIDEVLAVGDLAFQRKSLGKLGEVARSGRTVLFVTHNMTAVASLCSRAILLETGRVAADGLPRNVIAGYLASALSHQPLRQWTGDDAPGNDKLRLRRVELQAAPGSQGPILVSTPLDLHVEYERLSTHGSINVGVYLSNAQGVCLFNTVGPLESLPPGPVAVTVRIPGNLLNNGLHHVRVMLALDLNPQVDLDGVIAFDVQDVERSIAAFGEWQGAVRPQLEWSVARA